MASSPYLKNLPPAQQAAVNQAVKAVRDHQEQRHIKRLNPESPVDPHTRVTVYEPADPLPKGQPLAPTANGQHFAFRFGDAVDFHHLTTSYYNYEVQVACSEGENPQCTARVTPHTTDIDSVGSCDATWRTHDAFTVMFSGAIPKAKTP